MKYVELVSQFWKLNARSPLGSSAAIVYIFLLHRWSQNKCEDFVLSDIELSRTLKMTVNTIKVVKEKLREHGLIQYQVQMGHPCSYTVLDVIQVTEISNKTKESKVAEKKKIKRKDASGKIKAAKSKTTGDVKSLPSVTNAAAKAMIEVNPKIPSYEEFLNFARTLRNYVPESDSKIKDKYDNWVKNGWNSGYNRPITNWKLTLKSTMPYIINANEIENQPKEIPTINPPKIKHE